MSRQDEACQTEEAPTAHKATAAPRILPSLVEHPWAHSEPAEPLRRKRTTRLKADQEQIELELASDAIREREDHPDTLSTPETKLPMDTAPPAEEGKPPVADVRVDGMGTGEKPAKTRRTKWPEFVETVELSQTVSRPSPTHAGSSARSAPATSLNTFPARLTKRLAEAAHLPRHQRWKRRLHPASW